MSLVKILSELVVPSDVLQAAAYHIAFMTSSSGAFISLSTLEYMDAVVGSFREKRTGGAEGGVSVMDIKNIGDIKKGHGKFIGNNVYIYRTMYDWYVGLDNPSCRVSEAKKGIEADVSVAFPAYGILTKRIEKSDADRDFLTGCLTKKRFYADIRGVLKAMMVKSIPLWVFYMDFNNFKMVNDILGHLVGDEVLKSIAMEIRSVFLGYGRVYRVGGDEFVGTAFGLSRGEAESIAERIEKITMQAPGGIPVGVAVGFEVFEHSSAAGTDGERLKNLIDRYVSVAEQKMLVNKEKSKTAGYLAGVGEMRNFFMEAINAAKSGSV